MEARQQQGPPSVRIEAHSRASLRELGEGGAGYAGGQRPELAVRAAGDDAAAYLQQLGTYSHPGAEAAQAHSITCSVDDSSIERSSTWKELASWGFTASGAAVNSA